MIVTATGARPLVAGKPEPPMHAESVQRTAAQRPLVVGDRLDTDIEGACRVGADSLLVLTGVTQPADLLLAPPGRRPSYVAAGLGGLLEPHPEVTAAGGGHRCRGWTARWAAGRQRLELTGSGDRIDGLRALSAAAWSAPGITPEVAAEAVRQLDGASAGWTRPEPPAAPDDACSRPPRRTMPARSAGGRACPVATAPVSRAGTVLPRSTEDVVSPDTPDLPSILRKRGEVTPADLTRPRGVRCATWHASRRSAPAPR